MEYKLDIDMKQEKKEIIEDYNDDNYLTFDYDLRVKIEDDYLFKDWSIQHLLNTKFRDRIVYEEIKEEITYSCMLCGLYFSDSYSLMQHNLCHLRVPLKKLKVFICEHCPSCYYKRKNDLINHIVIEHETRPMNCDIPITKQKFRCIICDKTYHYKHWNSHKTEVHGELRLKCEICNMSFKCERYLKKHTMRIHYRHKRTTHDQRDKTKTIKCPKCPSTFVLVNALTTHLRNCHSTKRYSCHLCKSSLKCKSYLLAHMKRVHYNDGMNHLCSMCGKEFKSPRYLRVHMQNIHIKTKI